MFEVSLIFVPVFLGLIPALVVLYVRRLQWYRRGRHSPLPRNILRSAGHSLRERITELQSAREDVFLQMIYTPVVLYATYLTLGLRDAAADVFWKLVIVFIGVCGSYFFGRKYYVLTQSIDLKRLGMEGEIYVGQELDQLMRVGCRVFHDIPFPYGNIDHVVVSRSGVFAVNTKVFRKLNGSAGSDVVIDHRSNEIRFPDRVWRIPCRQLESEVNWLAKKLTGAVGQPVNVESILMMPGWFIKQRFGKGCTYVVSPGKGLHKFFFHSRTVNPPEKVEQIAHQLEQLTRDVEPSERVTKDW